MKNGGTLKGNCLEAGYTDFDGQRYFSIIRWGKAANCMWFRVCSMPEVIVMDEPSSNLDMESIRKLQDLIRTMKDEGKTILISEHRLWYLEDIADRYVLLRDGQIENEFTSDEILALSLQELEQSGLRAVRRKQLWNMGTRTIRQEKDMEKAAFLEIEGFGFRVK